MSTPNLSLTVHSTDIRDGAVLERFVGEVNANNLLVDARAGVNTTNSNSIGSNCSLVKTVVSSTIKTASPTTVFTAAGKVRVGAALLNTDGTGLAGGTNFQIKKGATVKLAETVANLGATKELDGGSASVTTLAAFIMDDGDTLSVQNTVADGTGAGVLTITLFAHRMTVGAALS